VEEGKNLGEGIGLRPDGAVVAEDGGGGEALALDVAEQVLVHVRLPRHGS
jgi:acetyl-CoA carboxylase alpha subunit